MRRRIACALAERRLLLLQGAQARQPLLRLARQLMGIGADGERQWKDGTACARNSDCSSGFCADKVLTDRTLPCGAERSYCPA